MLKNKSILCPCFDIWKKSKRILYSETCNNCLPAYMQLKAFRSRKQQIGGHRQEDRGEKLQEFFCSNPCLALKASWSRSSQTVTGISWSGGFRSWSSKWLQNTRPWEKRELCSRGEWGGRSCQVWIICSLAWKIYHIIFAVISNQNILHNVGHVNIGSFVAVTNFEEIFMTPLSNIIAGDLVLPEGGQGAGNGHNQGEDDQCSPAHSSRYFGVEK